jgi:hypothetical protein
MRRILFLGFVAMVPLAAQDTPQVTREQVLDAFKFDLPIRPNGRAVKNAPFSAEATTTTTQALADGNRIEQSTTQNLYRDSEGRERREESMFAVGALAQPNGQRTITVSDPVANISYIINPRMHTARRTRGTAIGATITAGNTTITLRPYLTVDGTRLSSADTSRTKEDLGSRTIEGVMTQGTRTTETIPAGAIGNSLPINVVDEVWYSPELKMNIMTTHSDPRTGQVVYKVTNINRGEQPMSLFEPPADYTVTGPPAGAGRGGRGPVPANQQ